MTNYNIRLSMTRSNNFLPDTGLWEELAPDDVDDDLIINQERIDETQKRMDDLDYEPPSPEEQREVGDGPIDFGFKERYPGERQNLENRKDYLLGRREEIEVAVEAAGKDPIDLMYQIKGLKSKLADCTCEEDEYEEDE